jgi:hypothetical protein
MTTAASRYAALSGKRNIYLERARSCAKLTIPHLFPLEGASESSTYDTPFQSLGARGVNNLASKLLLSLFPVNTTFARMQLGDAELEELAAQAGQEGDAIRTVVAEGLMKIENRLKRWMEAKAIRPVMDPVFKHLIVGGNTLLQIDAVFGGRMYSLEKYVVRRDPTGFVTEGIIKEPVDYDTLPENVRALAGEKAEQANNAAAGAAKSQLAIYTWIKWDAKAEQYKIHQEFEGQKVPNSEGSYPKDKMPFLFLRWSYVDGEDYGRSYIEQYYGDLMSLETLTKSVTLSSKVTGKAVVMVRPGGVTNPRSLSKAETGDVIVGSLEDVGMLQFDKWADLRPSLEMIKALEQRLAFAFLLNTAIQRNGDRVTAEEIRYMAGELDDALGGTYAQFSQHLQLPFAHALMAELQKPKAKEFKLPSLPPGVNPVIVTGMEALGRGHDLQKLDVFMAGVAQALGPAAMQYLNVGEYMARRALALDLDISNLIRSEEDVAAERQQQMQLEMMNRLGPQVINQAGAMMKQDVANQAQEGTPSD